MDVLSKKISVVMLGTTALSCSKLLFLSFDDPEGSNLLIVVGIAVALFVCSLGVYAFKGLNGSKKLLLAILIQIVLLICLVFLLG